MAELKIRHREGFKVEIRDSNVLVLSVKANADLSLQEALEIVGKSDLKAYMSKIELVAVIPASVRAKRAATISHAYVQFVDNATARECINIVDSMEYNGYRVHSPQLDAASFVKCDFGASIWHNPMLAFGKNARSHRSLPPPIHPPSRSSLAMSSSRGDESSLSSSSSTPVSVNMSPAAQALRIGKIAALNTPLQQTAAATTVQTAAPQQQQQQQQQQQVSAAVIGGQLQTPVVQYVQSAGGVNLQAVQQPFAMSLQQPNVQYVQLVMVPQYQQQIQQVQQPIMFLNMQQ